MFEILEFVATSLIDPNLTVMDAPLLFIGMLGLWGYNKIREPIKESFAKQLCVVAMAFGALDILINFLI